MRMSAFDAIGQIPDDLGAVFAAAPELINSRANHLYQSARREAMRSSKIIHAVTCHAEGEVGDVIIGGVAPSPGETLWEQSRFIAKDGCLRNFILNEPRGGVFRRVNLLVPPKDPRAQMGFIIMEPEDTPPMSGPNSICVATVLLDAGILPMQEPKRHLTLEAPGGRIAVTAECRNGKAERISIENAPSFANRLDAPLEIKGLARSGRQRLWRRQFRHRRRGGARLCYRPGRSARSGGPHHRGRQQAARLLPSRCERLEPHLLLSVRRTAHARRKRTARSERGGHPPRQDRSFPDRHRLQRPHGGFERARTDAGGRRLSRPVHNRLRVRLPDRAPGHDRRPAGYHPDCFRPGWITGVNQYMLDPADPWPSGYRLADTWPHIREAI
jgi:trans-L-3-hydroxyproline dehydratase